MPASLTRRSFLTAAAAAPALSLGDFARQLPPSAIGAEEGEPLLVGPTRDPVRIKVSPPGGGRFAMITQDMAPGSLVPIHLHEREDEVIFIHRGRGTGSIAGRQVALAEGSMLFVPQGTWHGGQNTGSDVLVWVAIYSPSGFEGYFREIAIRADTGSPPRLTPDERVALDRRFGIRYPG